MNSFFYYEEKVAESVEDYCKDNNITEDQFAKKIGIHPVQLSRVKGGKSSSYEVLAKIAVITENDLNDFLRPIPASFKQSVNEKAGLVV